MCYNIKYNVFFRKDLGNRIQRRSFVVIRQKIANQLIKYNRIQCHQNFKKIESLV